MAGGALPNDTLTQSAPPAVDSGASRELAIADVPLADHRKALLDLAYESASAMPLHPHIKNRSKAQELVVTTALELAQPRRARVYGEGIADWRRGASYAAIGLYAARQGAGADAKPLLEAALRVADGESTEISQSWRRDRIRALVAKAYVALGEPELAAEFELGLAPSESVQLAATRAALVSAEEFDDSLRALDPVLATGDLDQVRGALEACVQLFDQFYADADRRARAEQKLKSSWQKLPRGMCIELSTKLARAALCHADRAKALELVAETRTLLDEANWGAEHASPVVASLARLRFEAGETDAARRDLDAGVDLYVAQRDRIVNIERAGVLRALAEAMHALGDPARALELYKQATEAGFQNPNARPRAEDLTATCCSLALSGVEPDDALWKRLREIRVALAAPW